jgi:hypothetical protein
MQTHLTTQDVCLKEPGSRLTFAAYVSVLVFDDNSAINPSYKPEATSVGESPDMRSDSGILIYCVLNIANGCS